MKMSDKMHPTTECGCHVRGDFQIIYCALHSAAPDLLKELKSVIDGFERCIIHAGSDPEMAKIRTAAAREAIGKAEE